MRGPSPCSAAGEGRTLPGQYLLFLQGRVSSLHLGSGHCGKEPPPTSIPTWLLLPPPGLEDSAPELSRWREELLSEYARFEDVLFLKAQEQEMRN